MTVVERFLQYVAVDTESLPGSASFPSTDGQLAFAQALAEELKELGVQDVGVDENGYVYGSIPATTGKKCPAVGFIAHMDTSPDISGRDVKARIVHYEGGDILLNEEKQIFLREKEFESLKNYRGQDLIVTDGTTLLGGDDKAGIAEIMTMAQELLAHPEIPHGEIKIAFTPDEEIGHGTDRFDLKRFGAQLAYTVDGGELGELGYENFNAASGVVTVKGTNIHPGSAKGKMVSALLVGMEFHQMLPPFENPACTEGYEGFSHLNDMAGNVEEARLHYIIRDHDWEKFTQKKEHFARIARYLNEKYGEGTVTVQITDSYRNMKGQILSHPQLLEVARQAMERLGITPKAIPIRGGTDGARLSYMGLPCPNLCTGGHNGHGRYEYTVVQSMERIVEMLVEIARLYAVGEEQQ